ncbi:MAG: hypothetical protein V7K38_04905 [Nostoc sp.]|uniref:hypothetical protein n=1 Tax=Nostoc sp. TaxID=1180 RepID=UPI002FF895CA
MRTLVYFATFKTSSKNGMTIFSIRILMEKRSHFSLDLANKKIPEPIPHKKE